MLNKFLVEGRLTADPEIKTIGENRLCKFTIACERPKRKGEETAETDFFPCTAWNRNADVIVDWFGKGDMVTLVGTVHINRYEKDGQKRISIPTVSPWRRWNGSLLYSFSNSQASSLVKTLPILHAFFLSLLSFVSEKMLLFHIIANFFLLCNAIPIGIQYYWKLLQSEQKIGTMKSNETQIGKDEKNGRNKLWH